MLKALGLGLGPQELVNVNGALFFSANSDRELWKSDRTAPGTVRVADINLGLSGSNPCNLVGLGSKVFFAADQGTGFYVVDLKEVAVESYTIAGARTAQPVEEVTLSFTHATWTYTEFATTGKPVADHRAYWDFVRHEGGSAVQRQGFKISAVVRPGGTLGVRGAPVPGQRYQLLLSSRPEGPYHAIRDIAAVATGEERWEELPAGNQLDFFLLREAEQGTPHECG